jgi:hypothetical protein
LWKKELHLAKGKIKSAYLKALDAKVGEKCKKDEKDKKSKKALKKKKKEEKAKKSKFKSVDQSSDSEHDTKKQKK